MDRFKKQVQALMVPPVSVCLMAGLSFFIVLGIRYSGSLENIELTAYDGFIRLRPAPSRMQSRILIIKISEEDIQSLGQWPMSDAVLTKALENLLKHTPTAIGLDIFRDIPIPPGSDDFKSVLASHSNIICVTKFGTGGVGPPSVLAGTGQVGFNDMLIDPGGIVRRGLLFLDNGETLFYSFDFLLALHFLRQKGIDARPDDLNPEFLKLGSSTLVPLRENEGGYVRADARGYQYLIDFKDAKDFYNPRSLASLLEDRIDPEDIADKIVLIGVAAESVKDSFFTPFSRGIGRDHQTPGVILHARLIHQLIRLGLDESRPIVSLKERYEIFLMLALSLLGGSIVYFIRSVLKVSLALVCGLFFIGFFSYSLFLNQWWIPLVPLMLTWLLSAGLTTVHVLNQEKKHRALLMQLFSNHVSPEVADSLWEKREEIFQDGQPRPRELTATVLFSDIRGYSGISEKLDPGELIHLLNTYMGAMTKIIMNHGGVVDDYAGDGIKANFGVPVPRTTEAGIKNDAINAVTCALAMGREMERFSGEWQALGLPRVGMRIGVHTGLVMAGVLGSRDRMKYTTVGDIVNIAARLESYDKAIGSDSPWRVLIGGTTFNYLNGRFNIKRVRKANLEGVNKKTDIFRVLSKKGYK